MKIGILENGKMLELVAKDYLVKKVQILAKTGSGKSYTASKICEELLKAKQPIGIIDPVSAYWGLKEKFEIVIFGDKDNRHADYPLTDEKDRIDEQAELIADLLATTPISAIIDLKGWVESKQQKFGAAFARRIYAKNKLQRHIFIEEADVFIPQTVTYPDEINSRHNFDNLVRRGRQEGIGVTVISQRPALVSKNVLTQSDLSIYLNLSGASDLAPARKEINDDEELTKDQKQRIISKIKRLQKGEAFFYSPSWLNLRSFAKILPKETYHAGATRGSPDFREDKDIKLVSVNIEDVKEQLLAIASTDKSSMKKLQNLPALSDTKMLERQFKDQLAKRDSEIAGLRDTNKGLENLTNEQQKQIKELQQEAEVVENLRKLLLPKQMMNGYNTPPPSSTINQDNVEVTITETLREQTVDEKSIEGKLLILIANKEFSKRMSMKALQTLILENWGGDTSSKFYERLKPALTRLSQRPYQYVKQDATSNWAPTGKKIKEAATA